jgi:hypothetical protein
MNHNPSDNSANVYPSGQAVVDREPYHLNPSLGEALGCLDIKLEDELTRFRSNQKDPIPEPQLQPVEIASWEQGAEDMYTESAIFTAEIIEPAISRPIVTEEEEDRPQPSGFIIIDGLTTSSTNSRDVATTVNYAPMTVYREDPPQTQESLDVNFSTGGKIAPFHGEYLSSSQELLRQIQSGYPTSTETFNRTQTAAPTTKTNHFTPLKIGSMAAACALAGGVVYTSLNPSILSTLTATKVVVPTTTSNVIQTPNLAANEFTELNLSTLNNIKLPTVAAAPAPTTNVSIAPSTMSQTATTPAPVPFNVTNSPITPPATITAQPRLADSLIKSLLPPNFQVHAKPAGYQAIPSGMKR